MYSRTFDPPPGNIPEHYAGNAFSDRETPPDPDPQEKPPFPNTDPVPACTHKPPLSGMFSKLPDEDLLLILLVFLLSGGIDGEELPMLLLLLLVFQP